MGSSELPEETIGAALSSLKERWAFALIDIVEKMPDYRDGIVSHWAIDKRHANALANRGLVTSHTIPHTGRRPTELGLAVYARMRHG